MYPQITTACPVKMGGVGGLPLGQDWEGQTPLGLVWGVSDPSKQDFWLRPLSEQHRMGRPLLEQYRAVRPLLEQHWGHQTPQSSVMKGSRALIAPCSEITLALAPVPFLQLSLWRH